MSSKLLQTWKAVKEFLYDTDEEGSGAMVKGLDKKKDNGSLRSKNVIIFLSIIEIQEQASMPVERIYTK
jgi:hypothetical protein